MQSVLLRKKNRGSGNAHDHMTAMQEYQTRKRGEARAPKVGLSQKHTFYTIFVKKKVF